MRVRLLGPVSASVGDTDVRLGGRQQRAVFALLALQANQAVPLHRLAHEVWRDEPPARSTLSLQSYISRLRRSIAEAHAAASVDDAPPQLVTRAPGWALLLPRESVDALRFVDLLAEGHGLIEAMDVPAGSARLREALSLWSAEPFADLEDVPSASEERARLEGLRLDATEALFWVDLSAGRASLVADQARRFVEENPYRERGWGALMVALYRQGRQADALTAAQRLRSTLSEGLGIDPSPASRALHEQILQQDPALDLPARASTEVIVADEAGRGDQTQALAPTEASFVGRVPVLAALDGAVRSTVSGRGGLLVVEGPAGMGKSSVLNELSQRMLGAGGLVLNSAGAATGATPALWPWISIVRQVAVAAPELLQGSEETGAARALTLLDPSVGLGGAAPTAWGESDPRLARTRLYRAIVDLLALVRGGRPLAVVLDDLQWADEDTAALLTLAADELIPQGVLFVVALRSGEAPQLHGEIGTLISRHPQQSARLELDGLSTADVLAIIRRADPGHEGLGVAEAIRLRTGGNPLFVTELVQLLVSERRLDETSVHEVLPTGVRDVLQRRLDRLPDRTRLLLAFLALFDRAVEARLLAAVAGTSEESTLDDCEAAVASSLLVDDGDLGGFLLSHDLVRQTLEETISASRKARMHARIAAALRPADPDAGALLPEAMAEIAHHLTLAESVVGPGAAIPYLIAVADDARARSAFRSAESALRAALDLSSHIQDPVARTGAEADIRSRLTLQSTTVADAGSPRAPTGADPSGGSAVFSDPEPDPLVWWGGQILRIVVGRSDLALLTAERAISAHPTGASAALARSVAGLASFGLGRLDAADRHLETAEELSADLPGVKPPWIVTTLVSSPTVRSGIAALRSDWPAASAHEHRARERAGSAVSELVTVEYYSAWNAAQRGRTETTARAARHTLELAKDLSDSSHWIPMSNLLIAWARAMRGDAAALQAGHDAYLQCIANGMRWLATVQLVLCAEGYAHHGDISTARRLLLQSRELEIDSERNLLGARLTRFADELETASR